jgi:hypothetical protein
MTTLHRVKIQIKSTVGMEYKPNAGVFNPDPLTGWLATIVEPSLPTLYFFRCKETKEIFEQFAKLNRGDRLDLTVFIQIPGVFQTWDVKGQIERKSHDEILLSLDQYLEWRD